MKTRVVLTCWAVATGLAAAELKTVGNWKVSFNEATSELTLVNDARKVRLDGRVGFTSAGKTWRVVAARDAALGRLSLADPTDTVHGYVSFRGEGDRITFGAYHRAGAKFFPGTFAYDAKATVRPDSFPCRTFPRRGEQVLNFADGAGDSPNNDSVFAREDDLAVRFYSNGTRLVSAGGGVYDVHVEADIDDPAGAEMTVHADGAYYASRWAPGYHPIDRRRCPKAPTGWMSWNTYFDKAGAAENLAEAKIGAKYLKPFGLDIWSIESWQDNSLWLPVRHFSSLDLSCYKPQFPEGMKKLAEDLRALGFRPGIWMPLYGTGDKAFHDAHRDWFVHDADGKPIDCWCGDYMLDTTNEEALDHLRKITRIASRDWGYEFFKFDGMANTPRKFEKPWVRARFKHPNDTEWFDRSVRALREGIGEDRVLLGCMGDFTGTEARYLDASRLGADVVGCYRGMGENYNPLGNSAYAQMPVKWENVLHQAKCTFTQIFVNNIMFYTDPDTLLVGYALERHEAEVMATLIGLPGQLMFAGDKLGTLRPERMKIIQQVLPVADIHPQNLYPFAATSMIPVWNLTVSRPFGDWHIVALFNFTDAPKSFSVPAADLGLDPATVYEGYEFWQQEYAGQFSGSLVSADVPMRSVKLYAIRPARDRPQFIGDDRHITQGAVELKDLAWDAQANAYTVKIQAVGGFPLKFVVRAPEGYAYESVSAPGAQATVAKKPEGILDVTVTAPSTCIVPVKLAFTRTAK